MLLEAELPQLINDLCYLDISSGELRKTAVAMRTQGRLN